MKPKHISGMLLILTSLFFANHSYAQQLGNPGTTLSTPHGTIETRDFNYFVSPQGSNLDIQNSGLSIQEILPSLRYQDNNHTTFQSDPITSFSGDSVHGMTLFFVGRVLTDPSNTILSTQWKLSLTARESDPSHQTAFNRADYQISLFDFDGTNPVQAENFDLKQSGVVDNGATLTVDIDVAPNNIGSNYSFVIGMIHIETAQEDFDVEMDLSSIELEVQSQYTNPDPSEG